MNRISWHKRTLEPFAAALYVQNRLALCLLPFAKSTKATVYAFRELREGTANPVEQAGLRVGDVLVSVNGLDVLGDFQQVSKPQFQARAVLYHACTSS